MRHGRVSLLAGHCAWLLLFISGPLRAGAASYSHFLEKVEKQGAGGETSYGRHEETVGVATPQTGFCIRGCTCDTGSKLGFLMANVAYAMRDKALADMIGEELRSMVNGS